MGVRYLRLSDWEQMPNVAVFRSNLAIPVNLDILSGKISQDYFVSEVNVPGLAGPLRAFKIKDHSQAFPVAFAKLTQLDYDQPLMLELRAFDPAFIKNARLELQSSGLNYFGGAQ